MSKPRLLMAYKSFNKKYDSSATGFPSPLVSQEEKESPEYILQYLQAMYGEYTQNSYAFNERRRRIIINRKYAAGMQSVDKYKDLIGANGDTSYLNLDYSIVSIIPKFVEIIVNGLSEKEYEIKCEALDEQSRVKKDEEKDRIYTNMYLKDVSAFVNDMTGAPLISKEEYVPESPEEAEVYMNMSYKQSAEIAMEQVIQLIFQNSHYQEYLTPKIIRDLVNSKKAAVMPYFDENFDIQIAYCDVLNLYTSNARKDDFSDISHQAILLEMPLWQLRKMAGNQLTDDDIKEIMEVNQVSNSTYGATYGEYYNQGVAYNTN